MSKILKRLAALALLVAVAVMQFPYADVGTVSAAVSPEFRIEASSLTTKTGDIITVSFIVSNPDDQPITSFAGKITFNKNFFTYDRYAVPKTMEGAVYCLDDDDVKESSVGFTFSDSTGKKIPGGAKDVVFFQVDFLTITERANSVNFSAVINSCTVGTERVTVMVDSISVTAVTTAKVATTTQPESDPSAATTTTTTASMTTTTTAVLSSDCSLRELTVAPGEISPAFSNSNVTYSVTVENEVANIRIAATPNSDYALVTGTGVKDLAVGINSFSVTVTAQDGTKNTFILVVYREEKSEETTTSVTDMGAAETTTSTTTSTTVLQPYYTTPTTSLEQEPESDDGVIKIVGIVFGEIALFFFGFLSGFFIDKNIKRKREAEQQAAPMYQPPMQMPLPVQMPVMPPVMPDPTVRDDFIGYDQNFEQNFDPSFGNFGYVNYEEDDYYN